MGGHVRRLAAVAMVIALGACASSGTVEMHQPFAGGVPPGRTAALSVAPFLPSDTSAEERREAEIAARELRTQLYGRFVTEGVFRHVVPPGEPADYFVNVEVMAAQALSPAARFVTWAYADSSRLWASVRVRERATNRLLTEFDVTGESAASPFSSESGFDDAVREAAIEIVDALR